MLRGNGQSTAPERLSDRTESLGLVVSGVPKWQGQKSAFGGVGE